jgi:thymidylate synthase
VKAYHDIIQTVMGSGLWKENRTGIRTKTLPGMMFSHDMSQGFPLLTTKRMPFSLVASELEFFIQGKTDKSWLQERKNHIWDEWAHPQKAPYSHNPADRQKMLEEKDLGPIYGFQWRHFNAPYKDHHTHYDQTSGIDQLKYLVETLKTNPNDRRMLVMAWNPLQLKEMALPPCHYGFQVTVVGGKLHLLWNQRSVDVMVGLPFNIASYGLLLHLLAKESSLEEGQLVGFLGDVHIYEDHFEGANIQLQRDASLYPLPRITTLSFQDIFAWHSQDSQMVGYQSYPKIVLPIAV